MAKYFRIIKDRRSIIELKDKTMNKIFFLYVKIESKSSVLA